MGGFCCCPCPEDFEEYAHPNNPIYRHCICLRYFFHQLFSGYNATFQRLDGRTATSPLKQYTRSQREGLVLRRAKSLSYIQEESQALRRNGSNSGLEHLGSAKKRNSTETEEETKAGHSESDTGLSSKAYGIASYVVTNSEDEDVCPTCLEEYTPENPKIVAKCSHHFI
uniref:RING-type E3 ubiquitin transferase n=1 Tax=Ananas comosus var. bracteatus TaxID=296719 RepID=A0A6V7QV80_ANACO